MKLSTANFLAHIKNLVTGGGRHSDGAPYATSGFLKRAESISLRSLAPSSAVTATSAALTENTGAIGGTNDGDLPALVDPNGDAGASVIAGIRECATAINELVADVAALRAQAALTADETNARVLKVEETVDSIGHLIFSVPRDYDEATDELKLRVLASQLTQSTDDDVQLDAEVYVKRAGVALSADKGPTIPATVLSTTEQWVEFDFSGYSLLRDDVVIVELITDGHNDTDGEEVLIHDLEVVYRSCLVSYDKEDASGNILR